MAIFFEAEFACPWIARYYKDDKISNTLHRKKGDYPISVQKHKKGGSRKTGLIKHLLYYKIRLCV